MRMKAAGPVHAQVVERRVLGEVAAAKAAKEAEAVRKSNAPPAPPAAPKAAPKAAAPAGACVRGGVRKRMHGMYGCPAGQGAL